jgi:hypothetical protein
MEKNFKSLLSEICAIVLDFKRLNDVNMGETYAIDFCERKNSAGVVEERPCLRGVRNDEYVVTIPQLAALRIANGPLTAKWLDEFKSDTNATMLQEKAKELQAAGSNMSNLKFKVVAQVKIRNEFCNVSDTPVYQDKCYEGITEYTKGLRALVSGKVGDFYKSNEYRFGIRDLREKLHATNVKPGKAIAENIVLLPVFEII